MQLTWRVGTWGNENTFPPGRALRSSCLQPADVYYPVHEFCVSIFKCLLQQRMREGPLFFLLPAYFIHPSLSSLLGGQRGGRRKEKERKREEEEEERRGGGREKRRRKIGAKEGEVSHLPGHCPAQESLPQSPYLLACCGHSHWLKEKENPSPFNLYTCYISVAVAIHFIAHLIQWLSVYHPQSCTYCAHTQSR